MVRNALKGIDSIIRAPFEAAFSFILGGINEVARALERLSGKSILDSTKKAVSNPLKFLTGNATGTDHFGGGMTWVGEQGKELVQLPRGSKVIPNNQTKNYSGGGASTVNITVQAGAYMGSQQDARRYAVMIADALKDVAAMQGQRVSDMLGA